MQEFAPYVFQILSQLLEIRPLPLPPAYMALFPPLLSPVLWERSGNVPALVRLLQAYLQKAHADIVTGNHLPAILGVFQKLVASKAHDHEGFYVLNTLMEWCDLAAWGQYLGTIWGILFMRLQSSRTVKFARSLTLFVGLFAAKHSPAMLEESINKVQPGVFLQLLQVSLRVCSLRSLLFWSLSCASPNPDCNNPCDTYRACSWVRSPPSTATWRRRSAAWASARSCARAPAWRRCRPCGPSYWRASWCVSGLDGAQSELRVLTGDIKYINPVLR